MGTFAVESLAPGTYFICRKSYFNKVIRWATQAQAATRALCPTGDLEREYYHRHLPVETAAHRS